MLERGSSYEIKLQCPQLNQKHQLLQLKVKVYIQLGEKVVVPLLLLGNYLNLLLGR